MKQVLDYFCDTSPTIFESISSIFNHMSTKSLLEVTEAPATGLITMNHKSPVAGGPRNGKIFKIFDDDFLSFIKVLRRTSLALKVSKNAGPRELCLKYKI